MAENGLATCYSRSEDARRATETCPYRGLAAFQEHDAANYFGWETYAAQLAERVQAQPFVEGGEK